jgi:hypothetical protein
MHKPILPTLGSIAEERNRPDLWCDDDACSYLREHGYRYQVIYRIEGIAFAPLTRECRLQ